MKKKEPCPPAAVLDLSVNEALRKSEERYRALFEYAPDGVLIANAESFYIDGNTSICRMLGYSRDELIGLNASDIVAESEVRHIGSALSVIKAESDYHREWLFQRKDRSIFSAEVKATMMPDGNLMAVVRDISERKAAESALRGKDRQLHAADRQLAQIVQGMTEACFALDSEWCFTFVNDRSEAIFHLPRKEWLGRPIWQVFPHLVGTPTEAHCRRAMRERAPVAFEVFSPVADRWLDIRLFHTGDGLAGFLLDITDRKHFESALRDSEMRFGTAFRSSPVGIAINRRSDLIILEVNAAFLRLFECTSEEIIGRNLLEMHLFDAQAVTALGKQLNATGAVDDVDLKARSRLGKELHINISIRTILLGGENCSLSTMVDITGREKAAREIRDQLDELLRWQEVMLNREGRVQALKGEVNELLLQGKSPPRYADPAPR